MGSYTIPWRSIEKDGLPPADGPYLIFAPSQSDSRPLITKARYDPAVGWLLWFAEHIGIITHWAPLPEPPGD